MRGHSPAGHIPTEGKVIRWATFYDAVAFLMTLGQEKRIRQDTVRMAGILPGQSVLDAGCGTGSLTLAAKQAAGEGRVCGIDPSQEMIEVARRKAGRARQDIDFRVAVIEDLPFADATFDVVLSSLMLHHLPDVVKRKGLAETARVLKPGGRFFAVDLASGSHGLTGHLKSFIHKQQPDFSTLTPVLTEAGFQEVGTGAMRYRLLGYVTARLP